MTKEELRLKYKAKRKQLTEEILEDYSLQIANKALALPIWDYNTYHIFLSINGLQEINTEYLLHILQGRDKSIVVPKVIPETSNMKSILLQDNTALKISKFGVPEPVSGIEVMSSQIDVVFIPLLAYDKQGNRLGYGGGFYDRFLKECRPETLFIGLSFFEPEELLPTIKTDIPLLYCISPHKFYSFS